MEYSMTRRGFFRVLAGAAAYATGSLESDAEQPQNLSYTPEELKEFADVLFAEAANQKSDARKGIARVVMNRTKISRFPNTLLGVLRQENAFTCRYDGSPNWSKAIGELPMTDGERKVYNACYKDAQWALDGGRLNVPREEEAEAYHDSSVSIKTLREREEYWRTLAQIFSRGRITFYAKDKNKKRKRKSKKLK